MDATVPAAGDGDVGGIAVDSHDLPTIGGEGAGQAVTGRPQPGDNHMAAQAADEEAVELLPVHGQDGADGGIAEHDRAQVTGDLDVNIGVLAGVAVKGEQLEGLVQRVEHGTTGLGLGEADHRQYDHGDGENREHRRLIAVPVADKVLGPCRLGRPAPTSGPVTEKVYVHVGLNR